MHVELENHLHISEKTLAEYIIELSKGRRSSRDFAEVRGGLLHMELLQVCHYMRAAS